MAWFKNLFFIKNNLSHSFNKLIYNSGRGDLASLTPNSEIKNQAVPEPLTIMDSAVALGCGVLLLKKRYSRKR